MTVLSGFSGRKAPKISVKSIKNLTSDINDVKAFLPDINKINTLLPGNYQCKNPKDQQDIFEMLHKLTAYVNEMPITRENDEKVYTQDQIKVVVLAYKLSKRLKPSLIFNTTNLYQKSTASFYDDGIFNSKGKPIQKKSGKIKQSTLFSRYFKTHIFKIKESSKISQDSLSLILHQEDCELIFSTSNQSYETSYLHTPSSKEDNETKQHVTNKNESSNDFELSQEETIHFFQPKPPEYIDLGDSTNRKKPSWLQQTIIDPVEDSDSDTEYLRRPDRDILQSENPYLVEEGSTDSESEDVLDHNEIDVITHDQEQEQEGGKEDELRSPTDVEPDPAVGIHEEAQGVSQSEGRVSREINSFQLDFSNHLVTNGDVEEEGTASTTVVDKEDELRLPARVELSSASGIYKEVQDVSQVEEHASRKTDSNQSNQRSRVIPSYIKLFSSSRYTPEKKDSVPFKSNLSPIHPIPDTPSQNRIQEYVKKEIKLGNNILNIQIKKNLKYLLQELSQFSNKELVQEGVLIAPEASLSAISIDLDSVDAEELRPPKPTSDSTESENKKPVGELISHFNSLSMSQDSYDQGSNNDFQSNDSKGGNGIAKSLVLTWEVIIDEERVNFNINSVFGSSKAVSCIPLDPSILNCVSKFVSQEAFQKNIGLFKQKGATFPYSFGIQKRQKVKEMD